MGICWDFVIYWLNDFSLSRTECPVLVLEILFRIGVSRDPVLFCGFRHRFEQHM